MQKHVNRVSGYVYVGLYEYNNAGKHELINEFARVSYFTIFARMPPLASAAWCGPHLRCTTLATHLAWHNVQASFYVSQAQRATVPGHKGGN